MNYKDRQLLIKQRKELDYLIGKAMEDKYKSTIFSFFNIIENTKNVKVKHSRYQRIDWIITEGNTEIQIELKSRSCRMNDYIVEGTMYNNSKLSNQLRALNTENRKILKGKQKIEHVKCYVVIAFADALCYYEIHPLTYSTDVINQKISGRMREGVFEAEEYAYIDLKKFKIIKDIPYIELFPIDLTFNTLNF